ncbi:PREDICTED: ataxin-2 homolog isoform X1 [Papilio xuthus]|uniref:Ataxin-2 homolog isoform X1 n=1 Tax=Papilio xuthus TaxID=66420 RepID=A0AAJ7EKY5_PAPXU|nr:PREDICTED: ataxin-2 homolog isoform X1 [Papilio xuthus]
MTAKIYVLCAVLAVLACGLEARTRPRLQQPVDDAYEYEPQGPQRGGGVVLVQADNYDDLYRASDRIDEEYEPRAPQRSPPRYKQQQQQQQLQSEGPKQPPVQTIRNYNKVNDDGSFTFGYEAADGSFKEETRGTDCVVRGKYGYIDPDGNKREFTYVSGNPCDPNKPNEEDEPESAAPESGERDDGIPNYPTRPPVRPTTARPPTTYFQNDFRDADEEEPEEEPLQQIRPRVVQRPAPVRRPIYQQPQQIAITPRPLPVSTPRALPPATTFRPQLVQVTPKPQPQPQPQPQIQYSPEPNYSPSPSPVAVTTGRPGQIDFAAEFAKFHRENQYQSTTPSSLNTQQKTTIAAPAPSGNPLYSTELVYDPSSGQYNTQLYQTLPQTKGELNLNQRLQPFVAQRQPQAQRPFIPSPQIPAGPPASSAPLYRHQVANPQELYQRQQSETQFQSSQQLFAQQQQLQQSQLQRDRAAARAQAQHLAQNQPAQSQSAPRPAPQYYYVAPRGESPSSGQIDAFLRGHGIQF